MSDMPPRTLPPLLEQAAQSEQSPSAQGMSDPRMALLSLLTSQERLEQKVDQLLKLLTPPDYVTSTPSNQGPNATQRKAAEAWLIRAFQPFYRGDRPGHTWTEILDMSRKLGDAPRCSEATLRRARGNVMENEWVSSVSYWRLRKEYEYDDEPG